MTHISIDIGGTKVTSGLVTGTSVAHILETPSQKGLSAFSQTVAHHINSQIKHAKNQHIDLETTIGIGTPGKLQHGSVVYPGTAAQLGKYEGEFDNVDLLYQIPPSLRKSYTFRFINDAIAQMVGGIKQIGITHFDNETVLYIGPGTGLGGGIAVVSGNTIDIKSDGHIFDILIPHPDTKKDTPAEDIISGKAIQNTTGYTAKEIAESPQLLSKYTPEFLKISTALNALISIIRSGHFTKSNPKNNWPTEDQALCKHISHVLIGASIGTKGPISRLLQENITEDITLTPIPNTNEAALIGTIF